MRFSWIPVLAFAASVVAQDVSFGSKFATGAINQIYGKPTDPVVGTYVDTVKPAIGAQLTVNFMSYRRRQTITSGTPFDFIPTKSTYLGWVSTKEIVYGHLALNSNTSLHLTVSQLSAGPATSIGFLAILAPAILKDDASQNSQFWSLDTVTGELTFVNTRSGVYSILPTALAPAKVVSVPEPVHLVNIYNTTGTGRFYFRKAIVASPL